MKYILIIFVIVSCNAFEIVNGVKSKVDPGLQRDRGDRLEDEIEMFFDFTESQGGTKISRFGSHAITDNSFSGGVPNTPSPFGTGLDCAIGSYGSTNFVSLSTNLNIGPDENFNISFYLKQSTFTLPTATILKFSNGEIKLGDAEAGINNIHDLIFTLDSSVPVVRSIVNVVDLSSNQWRHLSINVFGNNKIEVYENGSFRGAINYSGASAGISNAGFSLCTDFNGTSKFDGQIDSLGIWRRTLSPDEIRYLSDRGI